MSYVVSARRYRPQSFDQLVGQDHVAHTLKNAITRNRVAHAYLFSGPRGVGKTSAARILAKSLNCEQGPTPDPCGACTFCRGIAEGRSLDLVEIDGASNRRIDEVRQLRENVRFVPSSARYKVYIIDENHMLTPEAFNALLKTLEEPPSHVVFVFATTEVNKVPATIRSRCQQFVFKRIPVPLILQGLKSILEEVRIPYEERALFWIAKSALGSMRDAQSILDQMISYAEDTIRERDVFFVMGVPPYEVYHQLAEAVAGGRVQSCFTLFDRLLGEGVELDPLAWGLIEYFRNLYVLTMDGDGAGLIDLPEEDTARMRGLLKQFSRPDLQSILTLLTRLALDLRGSDIGKELFEVTLIKLAHYRDIVNPAHLVQRLEELRRGIPDHAPGASAAPAGDEPVPDVPAAPGGDGPASGGEETEGEEAEKKNLGDHDLAQTVISHFSKKRMAMAEFLKRARRFSLENRTLHIHYGNAEQLSYQHISERAASRYIQEELSSLLGRELRVRVSMERAPSRELEGPDPQVARVLEIFKGRVVPNNNGGASWD